MLIYLILINEMLSKFFSFVFVSPNNGRLATENLAFTIDRVGFVIPNVLGSNPTLERFSK